MREGEKGYEPPIQAAKPAAAIEHATIINWVWMSHERELVVRKRTSDFSLASFFRSN
jgi:hypothetical protein